MSRFAQRYLQEHQVAQPEEQVVQSPITYGFFELGIYLFLFFFICLYGKKIIKIIKNIPHSNYHILGYITTAYLAFVTIYGWVHWRIDYGYYEVLRWSVSCFAFWSAYRIKQKQNNIWFLVFMAIGVLFNPLVKVALDKDVWQNIDIITFVLFCIYGFKHRNK